MIAIGYGGSVALIDDGHGHGHGYISLSETSGSISSLDIFCSSALPLLLVAGTTSGELLVYRIPVNVAGCIDVPPTVISAHDSPIVYVRVHLSTSIVAAVGDGFSVWTEEPSKSSPENFRCSLMVQKKTPLLLTSVSIGDGCVRLAVAVQEEFGRRHMRIGSRAQKQLEVELYLPDGLSEWRRVPLTLAHNGNAEQISCMSFSRTADLVLHLQPSASLQILPCHHLTLPLDTSITPGMIMAVMRLYDNDECVLVPPYHPRQLAELVCSSRMNAAVRILTRLKRELGRDTEELNFPLVSLLDAICKRSPSSTSQQLSSASGSFSS